MPTATDQRRIFAESEGDRWFARNQAALEHWDADRDFPLQLVTLYDLRPAAALEIGAANGYRVAALQAAGAARAVAVEVSAAAVAAGRRQFPHVQFVQAAADDIPLNDRFDLVIVNFVLHWIDRGRLLRVVAEVDRLLADGGHLILGDFLPSQPARVPYHHLPEQGVYTYKQDYSAVFVASGLYRQIGALSGSHTDRRPAGNVPPNERCAAWLLRKELTAGYADATAGFNLAANADRGARYQP